MISSSKDPSKWIFPKGGWELDETVEAAAVRETLEEAGAHAAIVRQIGWFGETAPACVFEARLVTLLDSWAEGERARTWMPISKAVSAPPTFAQRAATAQQLAPRRPSRAGAELRLLANGRSRAASMLLWPRRCAPCGTLNTRERRRASTPARGDIRQPRGAERNQYNGTSDARIRSGVYRPWSHASARHAQRLCLRWSLRRSRRRRGRAVHTAGCRRA